jgi:hypothetical protein
MTEPREVEAELMEAIEGLKGVIPILKLSDLQLSNRGARWT